VGGTLSAGGFGVASLARGAQIDHVERLRLVLPTGETVECSRTARPELLALALGGLGQAGVIETAVIATVPWRPRARLAIAAFDSLTALVASLRPLAGDAEVPDYFFAEWTGGPFTATRGMAVEGQGGEIDVASWLDFGEGGEVGAGSPCHVWSDYVFDFDGLARFAEHVELGMSLGLLTPHLSRVYLLGLAPPPAGLRSPFDPRPAGAGVRGFGIGLYYTLPPADEPAVQQARSIQDSLLDTCLGLGGRPYRPGYHRLRPEQEAELYGLTPPRAV
jgi:FAD/FMN-containing dehydrogenase